MIDCPACSSSPLTAFTLRRDVTVELCGGCKGMLVDERAFAELAGGCDLARLGRSGVALAGIGPCLRCNTVNWQWHALAGADRGARLGPASGHEARVGAGLGMCGTCGMIWFQAGELERLQRHLLAEKRRARLAGSAGAPARESAGVPEVAAAERAAPAGVVLPGAAPQPGGEPFERISFDAGVGNRLGAPLALALAFAFCATPSGQFLGSLGSMPFHELGHALASWLGSRVALPLPFFTVWSNDPSLPFGLALAALLGWLGLRSLREGRRFGLVVALGLLASQLWLSCFAPARSSLMCQILGGALGELVLGALVLVAFHFPLPDRLRWDFWRWPALLPGAVCFAHAALTWLAAARDLRRMPWGAAIGDAADGDMNRLVRDFGWSAAELARYLKAAALCALAIAVAYALALWRARAQGMARSTMQKLTS